MDAGDETSYPSIDIVRDEIDLVIAEQERRGTAFDNKAGFLLGVSGVLIGLSTRDIDVFRLAGQIVAGLAAAVTIRAMLPRTSGGLIPKAIRNEYLTAEPDVAKERLLDTRIWVYGMDEERLRTKVSRIRWAVALIALAVTLLVVGEAADLFWQEA